MDTRDWGQFLIPYEQALEELKVKFRSLRTELKKRHTYSPIEFVTGRIKHVSSILEKAQRLHIPTDEIEHRIEDIAGLRIMCQFVADIAMLTEAIRNRKDMTIVHEKDYVRNKKPSGYRSYHIIVSYPIQTSLGMKHILAEIQLRTLAMNFWATIEHSLSYKFGQHVPEPIRQRLVGAAEAAFRLDEEMSSIRDDVVAAQMLFDDQSVLVASVLRGVQELYFYNKVKEANEFHWELGHVVALDERKRLKTLYEKLQKALHDARHAAQPERDTLFL